MPLRSSAVISDAEIDCAIISSAVIVCAAIFFPLKKYLS